MGDCQEITVNPARGWPVKLHAQLVSEPGRPVAVTLHNGAAVSMGDWLDDVDIEMTLSQAGGLAAALLALVQRGLPVATRPPSPPPWHSNPLRAAAARRRRVIRPRLPS
jgi:hypothetical protein